MKTPVRILLLPICGLGDAVWYLPYLQAIRDYYPQAEIVVVVATAAAAAILQRVTPCVEIMVFNRGAEKRTIGSLVRLIWGIRQRNFDMVVSGAHPNSVRVPLFAFLSGAKLRIGAKLERLSFLYNRRVDVSTDAHYEVRYQRLLQGMGMEVAWSGVYPRMSPPPAAEAAAARLWDEAGLQDSDIVIGMVSGADTNARGRWQPYLKRWRNEGFAEIAKWAAQEAGVRVLMIGSAAEGEIAEEIRRIAGVPLVNMCGKTGLAELQWILSRCSAVVSNDTGTMHLAGALGTQVVALFGPTSGESFRPPGKQNRILQGTAHCAPCYPHPSCDLKQCLAMDSISSPKVIDEISVLLTSNRTVPQDS